MTSLSSMIKYTKSLDYYKTSLKCMKERCFVDTEGPWPWAAEPPSSVYWMIAPPLATPLVKARLHLQFLLRFLVRFSSSDACERVDEL
jgi:hypothetical protein